MAEQVERLRLTLTDNAGGLAPTTEPHPAGYLVRYSDYEKLERKNERLTIERDEARFSPMGDNHHNAAACPYCRPEVEAERDQSRKQVEKAELYRMALARIGEQSGDPGVQAEVEEALNA
jgi:hypothetical protein